MGVIQLSIPEAASTDASASASTSAASNGATAATSSAPPARNNTPSPVRSVVSSITNTTFSTTPVTSNIGTFFNASNKPATRRSSNIVVSNGGGVPTAGSSGTFPKTMQQQSYAATSQRPASFLQTSQGQSYNMPMGNGSTYTSNMAQHNNMMQPQKLQTHHQRGIAQQVQMPPASAVNNINPQWNSRMGGPGVATMQGGRISTTQPNNLLGTVTVGGSSMTGKNVNRGDVGAYANRNRFVNTQSTNLLGTVTVGGTPMANTNMNRGDGVKFGNRSRLGNIQSSNTLGTVTVGGAAMASTNVNRGDGGKFVNRNRLGNTQSSNILGTVTVGGTAMANTNVISGDGGAFGKRNRLGGAPPRPPMLPMVSTSSVPGRAPGYIPNEVSSSKDHQYSKQHTLRGMPPTPRKNQIGVSPPTVVNMSTMVDFENYHHGSSDGAPSSMDFGTETPSFMPCIPEIALTTDLVTLSVHEALTFDGVELALHPDVFSSNRTGKKVDEKKDGLKTQDSQCLRPGDLVEIRVWCALPGVVAESSTSQSKSTLKSKIKTAARPSLHSRNTSLATVSSSITNTSLMATPRPLSNQGKIMLMASQPPPLPKVVGGNELSSSLASSPNIASESSKLREDSLSGTSVAVNGHPMALRGEHLLDPSPEQSPSALGSNLSSVFAGAASSLFRKMAIPSTEKGTPNRGNSEDSSVLSRESSLVTYSTAGALHSRDSSLLTTSASWINTLNSSNSRDETPQMSPTTEVMEPVSEGVPRPHPLLTNLSQHTINPSPELQILPMRRDGPLMTSSSTGPPPPPPHPLSSSAASTVGAIGSGTSTSSLHASSPKNQLCTPVSTPVSTPPINASSSKKNMTNQNKITATVSQRLPVSMSHTAKSSTSRDQGNVSPRRPAPDPAKSDKKVISSVLPPPSVGGIPYLKPDLRKRASTADAPAPSDPPYGEVMSSHNRNHSIAMTGTLIAGSQKVVHTHRRYRSNATSTSDTMPSSLAQISSIGHTSHKGNAASDADDAPKNINDILQTTHYVRVSFVMPVSEGSLSSIKSGARTQVSLLRQVADLYNITAYDTVTLTQITRSKAPFVHQSVLADYLTMTFKDQFVSRGELYKFQRSFLGRWVYESKRLDFNGIRTNTKVIRHGDHVIRSGIISEDTKLTFRSRSARIIWLVQMSSEMWDLASPDELATTNQMTPKSCKIYFDKLIVFVRRLFDKWKKLQLSHNLTIVFFSRTYIRHQNKERVDSSSTKTAPRTSAVHIDSDGRMFEDNYKIVVENDTNADWDSLIHRIKKEFIKYPKGVKWDLTLGNERTPSTASQGNILEAINITLNLLGLHYIDRDLHRTGNSIVIITAGNGVFEIEKNLAGITKQRMMDNGIGSDMLSLGLPPLHVAPFFLFKEQSASSAEEIQGFDDLKTYFEVPHWMNLSFVDYDNEEAEPTLYKDDDDTAADANEVRSDNEILAQAWHASNGFLKRSTPDTFDVPQIQPMEANSARQQFKHLMSYRDFEDILQACRPRNRGEYGSGLPVSLTMLLKKSTPSSPAGSNNIRGRYPQKASLNRDVSLGEVGCLTPQRSMHASRPKYLEWGAVNFDDFTHKRLVKSQQTQNFNRSMSGSQSSPSSSFASIGSYRFPSQLLGISHLQSTTSLEGGGQSVSSGGSTHISIHKKHHSDGSMATLDNENSSLEKGQSLTSLEKLMADHDNNIFSSCLRKTAHAKDSDVSHVEDDVRNSINESFCPGSPKLEGRGILRSQSAMLPALNNGGIEAALVHYDVTKQRKEPGSIPRSGLLENYIVNPEDAGGRSSLAVSPLSIGMPYSLDRRNEGLRPSVMRLVAPDAIPRAARLGNVVDGFPMLDSQRNSFYVAQVNTKSRDDMCNPNKAPGQISKESRLGERRNSQREMPKESGIKKNDHRARLSHRQKNESSNPPQQHLQASSPQRAKSKKPHSRKPHHQSYRRRRKHAWVLNPFRQEDEDEVLAQRTHNRRRWSHVFPLGEDEFKRHAGPNWKSLCQPAILPMTIDFHPSPQDLEENANFFTKQYSVTLPPMDETTYKSHTELLDDLLVQRMRQDYQIVPRSIIQQSARREVTENSLEATLSMGHKIQRLSYNPSTDSVDVVQYYARFAEDENPQTYRYLLWSALKQDYVSVFQTFTRYTLPYKWNELDMLISGDSGATIIEGMRHPRISFVIIPDPFKDSHEEKEYLAKFKRLVDYFVKIQSKKDSKNIHIEMHTNNGAMPHASSGAERFIVDLTKKRDDKNEWMEMVHDSNCDTRRTFRITIQWLVAVASKIDNQAQLLSRRCSQYGLKLFSVPHYSCLVSCFMNPFAVPITKPIRNKTCVDTIEMALTSDFNFVYDGNHMSDPNENDCLDGFDFVINKWSMKKKKKQVPARQYLHRSGTLFIRLLRDTRGSAIISIYLNQRHIAGDEQLLLCARTVFQGIEHYITEVCKRARF